MDRPDEERLLDTVGMLVEASNELFSALRADLASVDPIPEQFLGVLIRLGRSPGGAMRMTQLAEEMTMTTSGLTRLVDRLETKGLVQRQPCPSDRRGFNAVLTDAGRSRLDSVLPHHIEHIAHHLSVLSPAEIETLRRLLSKLRDGVRGGDAEAERG